MVLLSHLPPQPYAPTLGELWLELIVFLLLLVNPIKIKFATLLAASALWSARSFSKIPFQQMVGLAPRALRNRILLPSPSACSIHFHGLGANKSLTAGSSQSLQGIISSDLSSSSTLVHQHNLKVGVCSVDFKLELRLRAWFPRSSVPRRCWTFGPVYGCIICDSVTICQMIFYQWTHTCEYLPLFVLVHQYMSLYITYTYTLICVNVYV